MRPSLLVCQLEKYPKFKHTSIMVNILSLHFFSVSCLSCFLYFYSFQSYIFSVKEANLSHTVMIIIIAKPSIRIQYMYVNRFSLNSDAQIAQLLHYYNLSVLASYIFPLSLTLIICIKLRFTQYKHIV